MKLTNLFTTASLVLFAAGSASGANLLGLFDNGGNAFSLGAFSSDNPDSIAFTPVTGVASGEALLGLDFRPATGQVYAIGSQGNVYTVAPSTAAASLVGTFSPVVPGTTFAFDFNPAFMEGEFARIISDTDDNRVISGNTGLYLDPVEKTDVFYAAGDVNEGVNPNINHIAYTNNILGSTSTQQFGIDTSLNALVTVANNAGTLETVGELGRDAGELGGFDIDGATGVAYLAYQNGGISQLFTVDLTDGSSSFAANLDGGLIGLTAVPIPEPSSTALFGLAGLGFLIRRRK